MSQQVVQLALFDFDGTIIPGDSIASYVAYARERGLLSLGEWLRVGGYTLAYMAGRMDEREAKRLSLAFLRRLPQKEQEQLNEAFVREVLMPRVYPEARRCIREHQKAGRLALLVSASMDNYMRIVARELGADGLLSTHYAPDGNIGPNCKGEEKLRRIQQYLLEARYQADWPASYAYGDSKSDLPMLLLAGHPVQVNPKGALKKAAPEMDRLFWGKERP